MTQDEAKKLFKYEYNYTQSQLDSVVDEIFTDNKLELKAEYQRGQDSILSRTCENCKFRIFNGEFENDQCRNIESLMNNQDISADFSCNRWEQKWL